MSSRFDTPSPEETHTHTREREEERDIERDRQETPKKKRQGRKEERERRLVSVPNNLLLDAFWRCQGRAGDGGGIRKKLKMSQRAQWRFPSQGDSGTWELRKLRACGPVTSHKWAVALYRLRHWRTA